MSFLNRALTAFFEPVLGALDHLGRGTALVLVSGIFGVLALLLFKRLSWQRGIKAAKDKIKAHLIEIRIYQDDLRVVLRAIGKVLVRNFQYLGLNLVPFAVLALPFTFVVAQLVVHYGFAPLPIVADPSSVLPGKGTLVEIVLTPEQGSRAGEMTVRYPAGIVPISPLVRVPREGRAFVEVVATKPGAFLLEVQLTRGAHVTKTIVAGEGHARALQPERGQDFLSALLWPLEEPIEKGSPFATVRFAYPDSNLGWLPGGAGGVLIVFFVASMAFAIAAIKPLKVQI